MSRAGPLAVLLLALALGLALRMRDIARSFWLDEAWTLWFARLPWRVLWTEVPAYETHPPFYYSLAKLLLPLGASEPALRLFPLLCSLAVLPLAWRIMATLPDRAGRGFGGAGLLAALLCALSAVQVHYGQEARPYAPLALAATLLLLMAMRWLAALARRGAGEAAGARPPGSGQMDAPGRPGAGVFLGLVLAAALTGWLHFVAGLFVAAALLPLGVAALAHPARWRALGWLALAAVATLLLLLPCLALLAERGGDWAAGSWMSPLTPYRARVILQGLLGPLPLSPDGVAGMLQLLAMLALAGWGLLVVLRRAGWPHALLLASCAGLPVLAALAASLVSGGPVLAARTMLPVTVPVFLLVAAGAWAGLRGAARWGVSGALVALFALGGLAGYPDRRDEPFDAAAAVLAAEAAPQDPVLVVNNDAAIALGLYLERAGVARRLLPVPAPYPALGLPNRYPYGSPALPEPSEADIAAAVAAHAAAPVVWLFERDARVPGLRAALAARRPTEQDRRFGPALRLTRFGPPRDP